MPKPAATTAISALRQARVEPTDQTRRFCWVVQLNHGVVVKAVLLGKDRGGDMGREWPHLDGIDQKCVIH